ncbi:MAG TPA: FG-GAP-like repeat-containing protein [Bryobacteraceae bacterium]|nr:FG-GAP-like repeat-containing protein [Bryobacteraceae bacterium]
MNGRKVTRLSPLGLWVLLLAQVASAQFETRSVTTMAHEPCSVSAADFRNNGIQDLAAALADADDVDVMLGKGDGTFQKSVGYPANEGTSWLATGALTASGNTDVAVANRFGKFATVMLGNGDGTFRKSRIVPTPAAPSFVGIGDFEGGQLPDLIVTDSPYVSVLPSEGNGAFGKPINTSLTFTPGGFGFGDFGGSGTLDLAMEAMFDDTNALVILLGNGDGTFRQGQVHDFAAPVGIPAVADLRGDGRLDLAVPEGGSVQVLLGNGDGTFSEPAAYSTSLFTEAVVVGDFNGDGKQDLVAVGINPSGFSLLLGNGDGTFGPPTFFPFGDVPCYAAVADFNGDGQPDLAVTDANGRAVASFLNTGFVAFSPTTPVAFPDQFVGTASAPQTVSLTNKGTTALSIFSMAASKPYTVSSTCGKSVAPGATCKLNVTFSPTTQGTFPGTVSILDSASTKPQVIEVSGAGTIVTLSPPTLTFGPQKRGTVSPPQHVKLTNMGTIPMTVSGIAVHGDNWTSFDATDNCPSSLEAGASCTITVEYKPLLGSGAQTANVYVTDSGGGSPQIVPLSGTATK